MTAKGVQKVIPVEIEGVQINGQNVTFNKLQEFSQILYEKLLNQRNERSFILLERDKLRTILENIQVETIDADNISVNKNDVIEKVQEKYGQEIREIEQEVRFVEYDHNINLSDLKKWEETLISQIEANNLQEDLELLEEKQKLKVQLNDKNIEFEEDLKKMQNKNSEELEVIKKNLEEIQAKNESEFRKNFNRTVEHLTLKHEMEMSELEERKNAHLGQLKCINKNRAEEMKSFFNNVSAENLAVISDLKLNLDNLKKNKILKMDEVKILKQENKTLQKLLDKATPQVNSLKKQLINYEKSLVSLKTNRSLLHHTEVDMKNVEINLNSTFEMVKGEILDSVDSTMDKSVTNFDTYVTKRIYLEELIVNLSKDVCNKQKTVSDLISDPNTKKAIADLRVEYWNPRKLSYELAAICKAHDDLLKTLRERVRELCVPEEISGSTLLDIENIGKTSSSFIAKQ